MKIGALLDRLADEYARTAPPADDAEAAALWFLEQEMLDPRTEAHVFEKIWGEKDGPKIRAALATILAECPDNGLDIDAVKDWAGRFHVGFRTSTTLTASGLREDVVFDVF
ncbi:MAG: hypothetical protein LBR22_04460 [Desulfovibrio sp.]|nr:hypothetical protein [Desulfovibrio sp.]